MPPDTCMAVLSPQETIGYRPQTIREQISDMEQQQDRFENMPLRVQPRAKAHDPLGARNRQPMRQQDVEAVHQWAGEIVGLSGQALNRLMLGMQRGQVFVPGLDVLQVALEDQIATWRVQSFSNFSLQIGVKAAKNAESLNSKILPVGECFIGYQQYTFAPSIQAPAKRMFVRLAGGSLKVYYRGQWQSLTAYANALHSTPRDDSPEDQQKQQSSWYQANGKSFNMFGLPAEIREIIYKHLLPTTVDLFPWTDRKRLKRYQYAAGQARADLSLLFVKHVKLHREASHMMDLHTTFQASHRRAIACMLAHPRLVTNIRHLQISLTHNEYFKIFGFRLNDTIVYNNSGGHRIQGLRDMRLSSLEIDIKAPSAITEETWWDDACQRTVVNWLFEAAWPWIRGHSFIFKGYIKTSQKELFESKGVVEVKAFQQWLRLMEFCGNAGGSLREYDAYIQEMKEEPDHGVRLDGQTRVEGLEGDEEGGFKKRQHAVLPPVCFCTTQCTAAGWTPVD